MEIKATQPLTSNTVVLLTDYRDCFYSTSRKRGVGMNIERLKVLFKEKGYYLVVKNFCDVNFSKESYKNIRVLYQSSEDPDLFYKDYIEDILLGLSTQGAVLVPKFPLFRAHHNKVFMEIYRNLISNDSLKTISAHCYGTYEDFLNDIKRYESGSFVLKPSQGSRSKGVSLSLNPNELSSAAKKASSTFSLFNIKLFISKYFFGKGSYLKVSNHRKKFIIQEYIAGLQSDYKIVVYGKKFYVLQRFNRSSDFRASGSGNFVFPKEVSDKLLNFAENIFLSLSCPFLSVDIAEHNDRFYCLEFQFVSFGQYAIEKSSHCFTKIDKKWHKIKENPDLEVEFVNSLTSFLN